MAATGRIATTVEISLSYFSGHSAPPCHTLFLSPHKSAHCDISIGLAIFADTQTVCHTDLATLSVTIGHNCAIHAVRPNTTTTTTTTVLWPLYRSTCVSWHLQLRTGEFCWCKVLLPTCPCTSQHVRI